jgi:citrate synthase
MSRNLLSADQASTRLGVQRATVYAYVSRGLLSRSVGDDGRTSWFDPDEVDALARRGRPRTRTERAGSVDVVLASGLTQIVGGHLRYRGHDVADLAATTSFEATAELLWAGSLPDGTVTWPAPRQELDAAVAATDTLPLSAPIAARLATAVAAVAAADEARGDLRPETVRRKARVLLGVLARTPAPVGTAADRTESRSVAAQLWPRLSPQRPTSARVGALDAALVLLADHELATSTLAARVAASTRANPFACVLSAIGALSGPLHGRAAIGTHRVLAEALATGDAAAAAIRSTTASIPELSCCSIVWTASPARARRPRSTPCAVSPSMPPVSKPTSTSPSGHWPWPGPCPSARPRGSSPSAEPPAGSPTCSRSTTSARCGSAPEPSTRDRPRCPTADRRL